MRAWEAVTGFLVLCCLLVTAASGAISVGSVTITPNGDFISGETQASVSFVVDFPGEGGQTFDSQASLRFSTDLENAQWSPILIQNGIENVRPVQSGQSISINGWELSYPTSKNEISLRVSLEGTAPKVTPSKNITVVKIAELNGKNTEKKDTAVTRERFVTNPQDMKGDITKKRAELENLRTLIDQAAAEGIDVTAAEGKYASAKASLENADRTTNLQTAQSHITAATAAINEGQAALGDQFTQKLITSAKQPIDLIDEQLTYFTVNRSLGSDPRVVALKTKRENVAAMITEAENLRSQGRFSEAQEKAKEARTSGDAVYEESLKLRKDLGESVALPGGDVFGGIGGIFGGAGSLLVSMIPIFVIIVVIVIIAAVALYLYRRRSGWDELG